MIAEKIIGTRLVASNGSIVDSERKQYLLRIHPASKAREETISELEWLSAMKSKGLILPEAVSNREGAFLTDAATRGGQRFYSTLLRWIEGDRLEKGAVTDEAIRKMGAMMANLHEASTDFSPSAGFARPSWEVRALNATGHI